MPRRHITKSYGFLVKQETIEQVDKEEYINELEIKLTIAEMELEHERKRHEEEISQLKEHINEWAQNCEQEIKSILREEEKRQLKERINEWVQNCERGIKSILCEE
ncbi:hypothetical protein F8M41_004139 [Gigaspora margarita]|uniref:Uncharacterized protein n=1 Tax=Gigaspora margarita TaxID=4874 RepID=A0A8H3XBJ2_GIGMA|nr:hypothetical protein F8M41_004139 [Gigaspora margarita]